MRNRLSTILAALALFVPAAALTGVAAQAAAAAPAAQVAVAMKPCPPGQVKKDYYCEPIETPTTPMTPSDDPSPSSPAPAPELPKTGANAGTIAGVGGGILLVGAVIAVWAAAFRRRHRFEA